MKNFFLAILSILSPLMGGEVATPVRSPKEAHSVVILGGGIGALTSAIYLARAGITPIVIEGTVPGGLLTQTHSIQNWPGVADIDGSELTDRVRKQAEDNGAKFLRSEVVGVDFSQRPFVIQTHSLGQDGVLEEIRASSVIIAMGTQPNFLGVPGETGPNGYWGKGVTNCAICDGALYRDQIVGVVGGGDAAVVEATYLANLAKEVTIFVRGSAFRGIEEKRIEALLAKPNVKVFYNTSVKKIVGDGEKLTRVILKRDGVERPFALDGLFLAIGSKPNTAVFKDALTLDAKGYIVHEGQKTSVEGVYAVGDIADPIFKQAITTAGDGAKAAMLAQQYVAHLNQENLVQKDEGKKIDISKGEVIEIASKEQFAQELQGNVPVIVDFYASWCGPCKRLAPLFDASATQLSGKVKFLKVNVDQCQDLSFAYKVKAMPTVILLDSSGKIVERKVGTEQIETFLKQLQETR